MRKKILSIALFTCVLFQGCKNETEKVPSGASDSLSKSDTSGQGKMPEKQEEVMEKNGIKLSPLMGSPEFHDAILEVNEPKENAKVKSGEVTFKYEVKNYELKKQTDTSACHQCNNSKDGQHIHLILNNEPYIAVYGPEYKANLKDGQYVALSFLSRSFHESIKEFQAFDLRQFKVGKGEAKEVDLSKPMLFYSRPKGDYEGEYTKRILLDFYLVKTQLEKEGNKVRANINGSEFIIDKWQPYIIEGLPMGESKIKLELIDKDGKLVDSPFNSIERKITLKQNKTS